MKASRLAGVIVSLAGALTMSPAWSGCHEALTTAHRIGAGEFCVLGFCLYRAELWSPQASVSADTPFALVLTYERSVSGERMVSTGIDEMQRLAPRPIAKETLNAWREDMQRAICAWSGVRFARPGSSSLSPWWVSDGSASFLAPAGSPTRTACLSPDTRHIGWLGYGPFLPS
ncbi:hypothetical protein PTE31013_00635 [Pandoraea terrigena]|uniref:Lipoprotein n=1 Tax=Pandoraea terrigena TaxID=2508292 RepID=A0A5E4SAC4_9BURK|nr:hypothetical protein PTE31013_00635 [Pandoraea terrigena]